MNKDTLVSGFYRQLRNGENNSNLLGNFLLRQADMLEQKDNGIILGYNVANLDFPILITVYFNKYEVLSFLNSIEALNDEIDLETDEGLSQYKQAFRENSRQVYKHFIAEQSQEIFKQAKAYVNISKANSNNSINKENLLMADNNRVFQALNESLPRASKAVIIDEIISKLNLIKDSLDKCLKYKTLSPLKDVKGIIELIGDLDSALSLKILLTNNDIIYILKNKRSILNTLTLDELFFLDQDAIIDSLFIISTLIDNLSLSLATIEYFEQNNINKYMSMDYIIIGRQNAERLISLYERLKQASEIADKVINLV